MNGVCFNCHDVLVDRPAESSTVEADPFPGAVRMISTGSYEGTLLLNKKTMFSLKECYVIVLIECYSS